MARKTSTRFSALPTSRRRRARPRRAPRLRNARSARSPRSLSACPRTSKRENSTGASPAFPTERAALVQLVHVALDSCRLPREKFFHRVRELRVPQPVRGPGLGRHEAARELVLALCAPLEDPDAALDAELQRLVIADLEMQQRYVTDRTPIAPVQRHRREDVEGACDRLAVELGKHHEHVLGKSLAEAPEEGEVEVGRRVMRAVGAVVAASEEGPVFLANLSPDQPPQAHARFLNLAPLLADFLALGGSKLGQELLETRVATVLPVELDRAAQHHSRRFHLARLGLGGEQHVQRRRLAREPNRGANQERARGRVACKQAGSRDRRKRDRAEQLGVVNESVAVIGVGPSPIENVFPVGMRLEVQGHRADQRCALPQGEMVRRPSGAFAGASRLVESVKKFMAQERLLTDKRVPRPRLDGRERVDKLDRGRVFLQSMWAEAALAASDYRCGYPPAAQRRMPRW